jgi:uncharacterized coiled-coil DUF342 family protein
VSNLRRDWREQSESEAHVHATEITQLVREVSAMRQERDQLRAALVKLVGVDGREELEQLEAVMRLMPAPAEDKSATIDAIHALRDTSEIPKPSGETAAQDAMAKQS